MSTQLTEKDFKESLTTHVAVKGEELHAKYGPVIGWGELLRVLEDRAFCRYPCRVIFDGSPLAPNELAHPVPQGERPEDGFVMHVQPIYLTQLQLVPYIVLYQLVLVNYGEFATSQDAETFGASALGLSIDEYYQTLCELAAQLDACDVPAR